jgi:hypothetical protein
MPIIVKIVVLFMHLAFLRTAVDERRFIIDTGANHRFEGIDEV